MIQSKMIYFNNEFEFTFEPIEETKYFDFWRLYYTAFSRAKNLLILTASERSGRGREPSRFFDFVYDVLPNWRNFDTEIACISYDKALRAGNFYY